MGVFFTRRGAAPKLGKRASDYAVGESVFLMENGTAVEYLVVHQGLPGAMYDASCDGTWLLRKDIYEKRQWHSSGVNDYAKSTIHDYLNSSFLDLFNKNTQMAIKQVKIPYINGTGNGPDKGSVASGSSGLLTRIFLLSSNEVGAADNTEEGVKLDYFLPENDPAAWEKLASKLNGKLEDWWLRSPTGSSNYAWIILYIFRCFDGVSCTSACGARPALVIDSATRFDPDTNIFKEAA